MCVDTMAHAINDRTVIMSVCSLMAVFFCCFFLEHALQCVSTGGGGGGGKREYMCDREINRKIEF